MNILGIIPARYGSTRLPGKALLKVRGKTIIERVYERVKMSKHLAGCVVATDDVRIFNHVRKFGGKAIMTRADHESGTSRCAEVLESLRSFDLIVNIQGDEPLIHPAQIDQLCDFMMSRPTMPIGTLIRRIDKPEDLTNPAVAKVVRGTQGRVLYFSRSAVPFVRDTPAANWLDTTDFYRHVGMYAYRTEALRKLGTLGTSDLERTEKLEQLNWLYHGFAIYAMETEYESLGVDTPADVELLEKLLSLTPERAS
jgi:3-deoxy-manno-octulosonate cytidylyltransferase (CMP-KDO synthetase)